MGNGDFGVSTLLWLDLDPRPAEAQMSIDEATVAAARSVGRDILRIYRWQGHTVTLGANERAVAVWDRERLQHDGIRVVRRPTGGRAVWHDAADLTYAWAGAADGPADVRRIYRELHEQLASAIPQGNQAVTLATAGRIADLSPGACFDLPVGGEVLVGTRKAIGSAQRVYGSHLLQHGAIALRDRSQLLARYRQDTSTVRASQDGSDLPDSEQLAAAIAARWLDDGAEPIATELTSRIVLASVEHHPHYLDPAWTWRR